MRILIWLWVIPFSAVTFGLVMLANWLLQTERGQTFLALLKPPREGFRRRPAELLADPNVSDIPGLDRLIRQWSSLGPLQQWLRQAGLRWRPSVVLLLSAILGLLLAYGAVLKGTAFPLLSGTAGFVFGVSLPYAYIGWQRRQRFDRIQEALPDALVLMARALRIGHTLTRSIQVVADEMKGPLAEEFGYTFTQQQVGLSAHEALADLGRRIPLRDVRFFVSAVQIQKAAGGNLAEILDKLSHTIRERFRLVRQIQALSAQGRLSGLVLGFLPIGVATILYFVSPDYLSILFDEPVGHWMLAIMAISQLLGMLIIRKIVHIRV